MLPVRQDHPGAAGPLARTGRLPPSVAAVGRGVPPHAQGELRSGVRRRLEEAVKKGGTLTGPNPTDRAKCGTAIHLATDAHGLPLAAVTGANANDEVQAKDVLNALVIRPPEPDRPNPTPDHRDLPRVRADGAYRNAPTRQRAVEARFRLLAPSRGQTRRKGLGLPYSTVRTVFRKLCDGLGITGTGRRPRLHDLRHTFACRRVEGWYDAGVDLSHAVAALSVYLGHANVTDTYWYLTATPDLLARAAARFETFAGPAGEGVTP